MFVRVPAAVVSILPKQQLTNLRQFGRHELASLSQLTCSQHCYGSRRTSGPIPILSQTNSFSAAWNQQQQHRSRPGRPYTTHSVVTNTTSLLRNLSNGAEVFLVGTAHVSKASADEVRDVIRAVHPDVVMVELDAGRAQRLQQGNTEQDFLKDLLAGLRAPGMDIGSFLLKLGMGGMYQMLKVLGMDPGAEFKVAMEEADRIGARVIFGDQHVQQTLGRLSAGLDMPRLMRLMTSSPEGLNGVMDLGEGLGGMEANVEALKTRAAARKMVDHLRGVAPEMAAALVDERDEHMVDVLLQQRGRVVAVVGLAHLDGIERRWELAQQQGGALPPPAVAAGR